MDKKLHFIASTNVKNLIGKDLVTDHITAVFELVKNSYDADAEQVRIEFSNLKEGNGKLIISDDGTGMDINDIQNKWMVIGTESKKNKEYSKKFRRPLNGDKGIGRFSVDRLGKDLLLSSIKENSNQEIRMFFDWRRYENDFQELHNVEVPYEVLTNEKGEGVTLTISKLRDEWNEKSIKKLSRSLRQFKSPFQIEDNFKIIIHAPEYNIFNEEIKSYKLGEISSLWTETEIPINNPSMIRIKIVKDGIEYFEEHPNNYNFGPAKCLVYFFNKPDKNRFNNRMLITVKDFGNIRLYRDGFRIYPYGDSLNDWLDLDVRKAQGHSRYFGSRDLIGYVQIYKKYNKGIDAPTNRQGIINNNSAKQLRDFIIEYPVKILEKYFFKFKKAKNEIVKETNNEVKDAISELKKVANDIKKSNPTTAKLIKKVSEIVEKGQKEQTKFIRNQDDLIKVYKRVASKEVLLHRIIHEALINIDAAKSASNTLVNFTLKDDSLDLSGNLQQRIVNQVEGIDLAIDNAWKILLKARDDVIQKKDKKKINVTKFIVDTVNDFNKKLENNNIEVILNLSENIIYYIDKRDLQTVVENFISNSIKSLIKTSGRERKIWIKSYIRSRFLILNFKDNGVGIPGHLTNRIFDPFFSTTESFGMGLSIVDEVIKEYNGELNLVDNDESGAEFQVKFRR